MYTVSQDGTLCIWESDTELEGLRKGPKFSERNKVDKNKTKDTEDNGGYDDIEDVGEEDGEMRGEVIKGSANAPKELKGIKNVCYAQISK